MVKEDYGKKLAKMKGVSQRGVAKQEADARAELNLRCCSFGADQDGHRCAWTVLFQV